ncbi:MAG: DUF6265 family protein [Candidatus Acidiferrales bacterium]
MFRFQFAPRSLLAIGILLGLAALPMASAQDSTGTGSRPRSGAQTPVASDPPVPSQKPSAVKLSDFEWLEGRWRGEWGPRVAEQVWLAPKAGLMVGIFRLTEGDKPLVIELFTLVQKPDGINFYLRHFTSALVPWERSDATILNLANADGKKIDFENPASGMPKRAVLTRIDADTYISRSEIVPLKGDMQVIEITYHRLLPDGAAPSAGNGGHRRKP